MRLSRDIFEMKQKFDILILIRNTFLIIIHNFLPLIVSVKFLLGDKNSFGFELEKNKFFFTLYLHFYALFMERLNKLIYNKLIYNLY